MRYLLHRNFLFIAGILAGLAAGESISVLAFLNMPLLMLIMTFSMIEIDLSVLKKIEIFFKPALTGILLNHIIRQFQLIFQKRHQNYYGSSNRFILLSLNAEANGQ